MECVCSTEADMYKQVEAVAAGEIATATTKKISVRISWKEAETIMASAAGAWAMPTSE